MLYKADGETLGVDVGDKPVVIAKVQEIADCCVGDGVGLAPAPGFPPSAHVANFSLSDGGAYNRAIPTSGPYPSQ